MTGSTFFNRLTQLINELITEVFIEQPLASPGFAKYGTCIICLLKKFSAHTISHLRSDPLKTTLWLKPNANLH